MRVCWCSGQRTLIRCDRQPQAALVQAPATRRHPLLKVYADPVTVNCRKVLAGLGLMSAPFELVRIDYFAGGHKAPEYLAINPNGALPAAVDADFALSESN